ncbi:MAG: protein translocase subunit SecF [bacterium]
MYNIIQKRKIWFTISGILVITSLILFFTWGLKLGIDFTGGSLLEVKYPGAVPTSAEVRNSLSDLNINSLSIQPAGDNGLILRFQEIEEETHQQIIDRLNGLIPQAEGEIEPETGITIEGDTEASIKIEGNALEGLEINTTSAQEVEELRFEAVGPSVGKELRQNTYYAIFIVLIAIILYVAWAFRRVSKPIASWKYGLIAIIALFHDVIIVVGVFTVFGKVLGVEVNTTFVAALLTVLGYSVNDTIVVFDRIRENLPKSDLDFEGTVNNSVNQSITRSINTALTTILALLAIVFFGGETIKYFALALVSGIFFGTYSSIFLASPLLAWLEKIKK